MKTFIAKNTWLANSDLRLDASYHLSDGQLTLIAFKKAKIPTESLNKVTERIFYGGRSKRAYVNNPENGLPFIKGADIVKADFTNLKIISRKRTAKLDEYFLEEGWTLITRSGTIGNTAYVNKDFIGKAASDDIIRVVPSAIPSGFLYAFLSSKNGKALLTHGTYGAVIQHIEPEHIENIPIPIFSSEKQQQIHDLIIGSAELRVKANLRFEEAIGLFDSKFSVINNNNHKVSNINIKAIINRLDATNVIVSNEISEVYQNSNINSFILISEVAKDIFIGPRSKRNYTKQGCPFLSGSELQKSNPTKVEKYLNLRDSKPFIVNENCILITRSGTIGNVSIIFQCLNGYAATDDAIRIVLKEDTKISHQYLFAFLNSKIGKKTILSGAFGSVIQHINEDFIGNLLVPIITENEVKIVNECIKEYMSFINTAILKENQAIQLVEKEIEQWQN